MNRRFSKALALLMAVSLCATPAFAGTITYNVNYTGGTAPEASTKDSGTIWNAPMIEREGYTFRGWSTYPTGEDEQGNDALVVSGLYKYTDSNVTLYAIWTESPTIALSSSSTGVEFDGPAVMQKDTSSDKYTITFKLKADEGKKITTVKYGSQTLTAGADGAYTITNVAAGTKVEITVETETEAAKEYTVTITVDAGEADLSKATITLTDGTSTFNPTSTDGKVFTATKVPAGTYTLTITGVEGYQDFTKDITVADEDITETVTMTKAEPATVEIPEEEDKLKNELGTELKTEGEDANVIIETPDEDNIVEVKTAPEKKAEATTTINNVNTQIEEELKKETSDIASVLEKVFSVVPQALKKITKIKTDVMVAIDISVKDVASGAYNKDVTVTIPVPPALANAKKLLAIHYHGEEKRLVPVEKLSGGKVKFTLGGLSEVVLVEYEEDETTTPEEPDNKPGSSDNRYVAYNPGGSSSGGGGGGSSSSNRGATSMFNSLTNTINGILKSQLSKGTVGAASAVTSTATAPVSTPATQAAATRAISQAVSKARANGSNSAEAIMQNVSVVSASILESIASEARKSGVNAYLSVDTMKNGIVDVRVRIPVSAASRLGRDVNMASVDNTAVKARFNRYYSNRLDVVALAQNGSFGVPASVAARLSLGNANAADLHFYSFNAATNSYQEMVQTGAFIDVNGYLHFNTELGGYIIVSVGSLELK